MALYFDLPVFKVGYELYLAFVVHRRTLPREERYTIGQELDRAMVEVLVLVQRINATRDKVPLIVRARQLVVEIQVRTRVLRDIRALSVAHFAEWKKLPKDKSLFCSNEGCGLPIGNLSSQLFSNIYLGMLDDFVKRDLKVKYYGRYVDDLFVIGESKEYVKSLVEPIRVFLRDKLRLELSENKICVCDARRGVEFLGAFVKPFRTYVASRSLRRIRAHLHAVSQCMSASRAQAVVNSSLGVLSHYDSYCVRRCLIEKSNLPDLGRISDDGLRFYPDALTWRINRVHLKGQK